jgi:hypothetical protein
MNPMSGASAWRTYWDILFWVLGAFFAVFGGRTYLSKPQQESLPDATQIWFDRIDIDHNQHIEPSEFGRITSDINVFDQLDVNHNGTLSIDEMETLLVSLDPFVFYEDVE